MLIYTMIPNTILGILLNNISSCSFSWVVVWCEYLLSDGTL